MNGTEIFYEVAGEGEPVVLIPGLGVDHRYYAYAAPRLAEFTRVISLDLRGIGQSAKPQGSYTMELWADDVHALLQHLGLRQAHIVGSSLGGCVAMELAYKYPDMVKSLMLVAAFSRLDRALERNFRMRIAIVEQLGLGDVMADHVTLWTLDRKFTATERGKAAVEALMANLRNGSPSLYVEFLKAILRFGRAFPEQAGEPPFTQRLPELHFPTLLIVGDKDILTPVEFSQEMLALLPQAELAVLKDCGHITFIEQPEECTQLVTAFVRKVVGGANQA